MTNEETLNKMRKMRLHGMVENYLKQVDTPGYETLDFDERLGLMVDAEYQKKQQNRIDRLLRNARFTLASASLEAIDYRVDRKLDRSLILKLATGNYLAHAHNIIINGATGAGKSYLAQALGTSACRQGATVYYFRLHDLLEELMLAKSEGVREYIKRRKIYERCTLLIIDEWLTFPIQEDETEILLSLIDRRTNHCATIVASQYAPAEWLEQIPNAVAAEAITDRLTAGACQIVIQGKRSMRASDLNL